MKKLFFACMIMFSLNACAAFTPPTSYDTTSAATKTDITTLSNRVVSTSNAFVNADSNLQSGIDSVSDNLSTVSGRVSYVELDVDALQARSNVWNTAASTVSGSSNDWNSAFSWGDHAGLYLGLSAWGTASNSIWSGIGDRLEASVFSSWTNAQHTINTNVAYRLSGVEGFTNAANTAVQPTDSTYTQTVALAAGAVQQDGSSFNNYPYEIGFSETGTDLDNYTVDYSYFFNGKPKYYHASATEIFWVPDVWICVLEGGVETWTNVLDTAAPPKTGWSTGSWGSPAPTLIYSLPSEIFRDDVLGAATTGSVTFLETNFRTVSNDLQTLENSFGTVSNDFRDLETVVGNSSNDWSSSTAINKKYPDGIDFLLWGQSNARGYTSSTNGLPYSAYSGSSGGFISASNKWNVTSTTNYYGWVTSNHWIHVAGDFPNLVAVAPPLTYGPDLPLIDRLQGLLINDTHGYKAAVGGSSITQWLNTGDYWDLMVAAYTNGRSAWPNSRVPDWGVWMQGETESLSDAASAAYYGNQTNLIAQVRSYFNNSRFNIILVGLPPDEYHNNAYGHVVEDAKIRAASEDPNVFYIQMHDLPITTEGGDEHYGSAELNAYLVPRIVDIMVYGDVQNTNTYSVSGINQTTANRTIAADEPIKVPLTYIAGVNDSEGNITELNSGYFAKFFNANGDTVAWAIPSQATGIVFQCYFLQSGTGSGYGVKLTTQIRSFDSDLTYIYNQISSENLSSTSTSNSFYSKTVAVPTNHIGKTGGQIKLSTATPDGGGVTNFSTMCLMSIDALIPNNAASVLGTYINDSELGYWGD